MHAAAIFSPTAAKQHVSSRIVDPLGVKVVQDGGLLNTCAGSASVDWRRWRELDLKLLT